MGAQEVSRLDHVKEVMVVYTSDEANRLLANGNSVLLATGAPNDAPGPVFILGNPPTTKEQGTP